MIIVAVIEVIVCFIILKWLLKCKNGEKFSKGFIIKTLLFGLLSTIIVLAISFVIPEEVYSSTGVAMMLLVIATGPILEEVIKFIVFILAIRKSDEVKTVMDSMLACGIVAVGFMMFENVEYSLFGDASTLLRVIFPCHLVFGLVMGYFYGKAKQTGKSVYKVLSLVVPIILHTFFDAPVALIRGLLGHFDTHMSPEEFMALPNFNLIASLAGIFVIMLVVFLILIIASFIVVTKLSKDQKLEM